MRCSDHTRSSRSTSVPVTLTRCPTWLPSFTRLAESTTSSDGDDFLRKPDFQLRVFGRSLPAVSLSRNDEGSFCSRQPVMRTMPGSWAGTAGVSADGVSDVVAAESGDAIGAMALRESIREDVVGCEDLEPAMTIIAARTLQPASAIDRPLNRAMNGADFFERADRERPVVLDAIVQMDRIQVVGFDGFLDLFNDTVVLLG